MSKPEKSMKKTNIFFTGLNFWAKRIVAQLLKNDEQENQQFFDKNQQSKKNTSTNDDKLQKSQSYTEVITKDIFKTTPKFFYWLKLISKFISVQLVVQLLGFASGILIVRTLSKEEYAYFTIANSLQSVINVLADTGLSSSIISIGGKIWQDDILLNQLLHTGMRLRYYMGISASFLIVPIMGYLLISNGASIFYTLFVIIAILIELNYYFCQQIFYVIPLLKSRIKQIQYLDITFASSRLVLIGIASLMSVNAFIYLFCSTIASGLRTFLIKKWNSDVYLKNNLINKAYEKQIIYAVKNQIPYTIFWCIQGQITILLISSFGNTSGIADVGALGRFAAIFAPLNAVVSSIFIPSIARCQSMEILKKYYFKAMLFYITISTLFIAISLKSPQMFLWILGSKYNNLHQELLLIVVTTIISLLISLNWGINHSRGWIKDSWLIIPSTIITQIVALMFIDVSITKGILLFGIVSSLPTLIVNFYLIYRGLNSFKKGDV